MGTLVRYGPESDPKTAYLTKVDGSPKLIQQEPARDEQAFIADGFSFLRQLDEWGYADDFVNEYPLAFGGLNVYGSSTAAAASPRSLPAAASFRSSLDHA